MPDYPTSLCLTVSLYFDAFTISQMCLRIVCSLDICLFYCISLPSIYWYWEQYETYLQVHPENENIYLISLCELQSENHLQKCLLFPQSWKVTLKIRLLQFLFCAGLCQSVSCPLERLYGGAFFSCFPLSFSRKKRKMPCLLLKSHKWN